jgi:excisionase family DNA binding protein
MLRWRLVYKHNPLASFLASNTQAKIESVAHQGVFPMPTLALNDDDLIDATQLARILGVQRAYVYQLIKTDHLPCVRISRRCIRFKRAEVAQWLLKKHEERAECPA